MRLSPEEAALTSHNNSLIASEQKLGVDSSSPAALSGASPEENKGKNSSRWPKSAEILSIDSSVSPVGSISTKTNDPNDNDQGPEDGIVELGSDFQAEVERALSSGNAREGDESTWRNQGSLVSPTATSPDPKVDASAEKKSGKTFFASLGGTLGGTLGGLWTASGGSAGDSKEKNEKSKPFSKFYPFKGDSSYSIPSDSKKVLSPTRSDNNSITVNNSTSSDSDSSFPVRGEGGGASIALQSSEPFKAHTEAITGLSLSADGRTVASCSKDSTMKVIFDILPFLV